MNDIEQYRNNERRNEVNAWLFLFCERRQMAE